MAGPLQGMRVVELAHIMSGPICGTMLADMGADMIKVEKYPEGDDSRRFPPILPCGESASFMMVNRNKRGIALNLKTAGGREVLTRLLQNADVLTENFRLGTMEKLGLGYETLRIVNPGLIYCAISGFGRTGPLAEKGGFDLIAQGMGGLMSTTGEPGQAPIKAGSPVADINAGLLAALGIAAAYAAKQRTGLGQMVDTSLFEAAVQQMFWPFASYFADGTVLPKMGSANSTSAPYQVFRSRDGWINLGAANQNNYDRLVEVLAAPELAADPRFATALARMKNRDELIRLLSLRLAQRTTAEWMADFDEAGLPAGPVLEIPAVVAHPQTQARGMIRETEHPVAGKVQAMGLPIHFSGGLNPFSRPAPMLGEFGYSADEIGALRRDNCILARPPGERAAMHPREG